MTHACSRVFYHFVWATWDREPLLTGKLEQHAYALIRRQCKKMGCQIHEIGGTFDHIHLLVSLPTTLYIADFIESIKGCSSRAMNQAHESETLTFKWQGGYGVLTVSPSDVARVRRYIQNQKEHHETGSLWPAAERSFEN